MAGRTSASSSASPDDLTLDQRLCLALYTASRAMTARYRVALSQLGLTYPQYLVMVLLWEEDDCSVGRIGQRLSLDSSTLSPLLKRLQAMNLVTRTRATADERLMIIGLTERGRRMRDEAAHVTADMCEATGITVAEQLELVSRLRELTSRLDASTADAARRP
jgi:DNA-binding MarR family transcriptional regulator